MGKVLKQLGINTINKALDSEVNDEKGIMSFTWL